jgi:hypothetical protein
VFTLNEMRSKGVFDTLVGHGPIGEKMFADNALFAMAKRMASQGNASARKAMFDMLAEHALPISKMKIDPRSAKRGEMVTMWNGQRAEVRTFMQGGVQYLNIGGVNYRQMKDLPAKAFEGRSARWIGLNAESARAYYPEKVAEFVERFTAVTSDDRALEQALKAVNTVTGYWKAATLLHPSWFIFNHVGNVILAAMGRVLDPVGLARRLPEAERLWRYRNQSSELAKIKPVLRGVEQDGEELLRESNWGRVTNTTMAQEVMVQMHPNGYELPASAYGTSVRQRAGVEARRMKRAARTSIENMAEAVKGQGGRPSLNAGKPTLYSEGFLRKAMSWYAGVNSYSDNVFRLALYLDLLDKGEAPTSAAQKIVDSLFDFTDATHAESKYAKTIIPFYAWVRNNGAFQIRQLLQNPKWAAMVPKAQDAIEEAVANDDKIPEHMRPRWIREQLGIQVGRGGGRTFFMAGSVLPQEPVFRALAPAGGTWSGTQSVLDFFGSQINPVLSSWVQAGIGREFYSGRTIGPEVGKGDIALPDFLLNQFMPRYLRELSPAGPASGQVVKAFERGAVPGALRLTLGGRAQPGDDDRIRTHMVRQFRVAEDDLRKAIVSAEREGRGSLSLRARTQLLSMYRLMRETGFEDQVPKWAIARLDQLAAGSREPVPQ